MNKEKSVPAQEENSGTTGIRKYTADYDDLKAAVDKIFNEKPVRIIFSDPRASEEEFVKVVISPKLIGRVVQYQAEKFTKTQVFHENIQKKEAPQYAAYLLMQSFKQMNAFSGDTQYNLRISKKGKVMAGKSVNPPSSNKKNIEAAAENAGRAGSSEAGSSGSERNAENAGNIGEAWNAANYRHGGKNLMSDIVYDHDRKKKRLIKEGTIVAPLVDMGVFTKDGKVVKSMGDKFRQINRFLEIIDDAVEICSFDRVRIIDFGCGKAYLTFIVYYYLTYVKKIETYITGLDLKEDIIEKCSAAARKYGYENLKFEVGDISEYECNESVDIVITLHACDTATDYALHNAVKWGSRVILSVPCCQHELNAQIKSDKLSALTKYGLLKERFAAIATDAVRASLLEYLGYKTQVLEFIDFSHTPKNVLIRAVKSNVSAAKREKSLSEAESLMNEFQADQTLYRLIKGDN